MKKTISENEFIKNNCTIDCNWNNLKNQWTIKVKHLTSGNSFSPVRVTIEGFENFQSGCDEAMMLFKRNLRNKIQENQVVKAHFDAVDVWPEFLTEKKN